MYVSHSSTLSLCFGFRVLKLTPGVISKGVGVDAKGYHLIEADNCLLISNFTLIFYLFYLFNLLLFFFIHI